MTLNMPLTKAETLMAREKMLNHPLSHKFLGDSAQMIHDFTLLLVFHSEVPSCPVPTLTNGLIQDVPPFLLGSQIQFSCLEDYQLNGASSSTCVETMGTPQWEPLIPTCEPGEI